MGSKGNLRNITLSANTELIEEARKVANEHATTLNDAFRAWLEQFVRPAASGEEYDLLMKRLSHVSAGKHFSRDEMNER